MVKKNDQENDQENDQKSKVKKNWSNQIITSLNKNNSKSAKNTIKKNDGKNDGENDEKPNAQKNTIVLYSKGAKKVTLLEGNEKGNIRNVKKRLHFQSVTKSVTNNVTFQM